VLIVGAGLAGLSAAQNLRRAKVDVHVVEARDRVGGRTFARSLGRAIVDHGAQWIGADHQRMLGLARAQGLELFETYTSGRKQLESRGKLSSYTGEIPSLPPLQLIELQSVIWRINWLARSVPREHPLLAKKAKELDALSLEAWIQRNIFSRRVRGILDAAVRVVWGAEASEVSLLHFLWYVNSSYGLNNLVEAHGANQHWRVSGGTQQIAVGLAAEVEDVLSLGQTARAIRRQDRGYRVSTNDLEISAERVVIAIPPALTSRIHMEPALPALRAQYAQRVPMGSTIKAHLAYATPFWRESGWSGEVVSDGSPLSVVYDNTDAAGEQPCLVGFIVADAARRLGAHSQAERQEAVIETLCRYFGPQAANCTAYDDHVWAAEPFSGGAPVGFHPPGALSGCGKALREPIDGIHWAGTETAREWTGFMEGAIESGQRAANEILEQL
jgi:monoamine oxidase